MALAWQGSRGRLVCSLRCLFDTKVVILQLSLFIFFELDEFDALYLRERVTVHNLVGQ